MSAAEDADRSDGQTADAQAAEAPDADIPDTDASDAAGADAAVGWRDTVGWVAVATLSYLVLLQGYELWSGVRVDLLVKAGTTVAVAAIALVTTTLIARQLEG